ncbi:unnamed protein product [Knipowitschia caucasica]|uniref:Uncharacterized protein n=1 Tax=Knipowitschia caucasica TaxID=637954 RepID=A0AAV2JSX1_KNICA
MDDCFLRVCVVIALICGAQATYSYHASRCECGGLSRYCLRDALGLRCVDCQGNTEGRHCERCRAGFYHQGAQRSCTACQCHAAGSVSSQCDSRGRCSCASGFTGHKCDLCADGQTIGADGCKRSRSNRQDSGSWSPSCFCFGHSSECSVQPGYYVHNISSSFSEGLDGWRAATPDGNTPRNVHFRWSPRHQDVEVISSSSLPVYMYAPARFLGDKLHSYGQNLSFALRLDRGVRHPSVTDVILEGAGLSVSTSLGDLRHSVPCGQKLHYTFRLDEKLWSPQLSSFMFQTLLQNLTAIKIRATFGNEGRGYLDNVSLVSAHPSPGTAPARWVQTCQCPPALEGHQCERCSPGYMRTQASRGSFSACQPCQCPKGSCDALTGECLSSDDNNQGCPTGYTGAGCSDCAEGFYRENVRGDGFPAPCQPCECDQQGAVSTQCSSSGTCECRPGFEGQKCSEAKCPACFNPVITRLDQFWLRVQDLDSLASDLDPSNSDQTEAALRAARRQLEELQDDQILASDAERRLKKRLTSVTADQLRAEQQLDRVSQRVQDVQDQQASYRDKQDTTQDLIQDMRGLLRQARAALTALERPQADSPSEQADTNPLTSLLDKALDLLKTQQSAASSVAEDSSVAAQDTQQSAELLRRVLEREGKVQQSAQDLKRTFEQISAEVKDLEARAPGVSSDATDQSRKAAALLKDLLNLEKQLPTSLQAEADAMSSGVDRLKAEAEGNMEDLDRLKAATEEEQSSAVKLLDQGKAAQETFDKLVDRVDQAKSDTEDALRRINSNTASLEDSLSTLKGFEQQMDGAKSLADAAIARLPAIQATVKSAQKDNTNAQGLVEAVREQLDQAGQGRDQLKAAVDKLEASRVLLPSGLLENATVLRNDAEQLEADSFSTADTVRKELEEARKLKRDSEQGVEEAQAALENSLRSRDAVRRTLRDVHSMINSLNGSEPLDLSRLQRLEQSLLDAQRDLTLSLGPRLEQLQEKERAHRLHLLGLEQNLSTILSDIQNVEDILNTVPKGCYNNPPLEEA